MTVLYADTSAIVRAYFVDEPDHKQLRELLLDGTDAVVSSELARVEMASAIAAAARTLRLKQPHVILDRFDADCGDDGPLALLRLDPDVTLPLAYRMVSEHRLRTLDAIHLAVALVDAAELAGGDSVCVVTRDNDQAAAARALGLETA